MRRSLPVSWGTRRRRWKPQSPKAIQNPLSQPPAGWSTAVWARCSPPSAPPVRCWSTRPGAGWPHRRLSPRRRGRCRPSPAAANGRRIRQRRRRAARIRASDACADRPRCRPGDTDRPDLTHHQHESIAMTSTASQPIINTDLVLLDVDAGGDKQTVIGRLVSRLADAGRTHDTDGLIAAAMAREEQSATRLPGGIAIPHCRSPYVDTASIGFARLNPAVDFGAPDGPADLAFLIAAPEAGGAEHMKLLSSLARALVRKEFVASLRGAANPDEVVALVDEVLNPADKAAPKSPAQAPVADTPKTLVAITACPTGIAHTYMAADSLAAAAKDAGVTLHVETQGSS